MIPAWIRDEKDVSAAQEEWCAGNLWWLLHESQIGVYRNYRKWQMSRKDGTAKRGKYERVFVFDCARRWGKDVLCTVIKAEDAIRRSNSVQHYGTSFANDVKDIIVPIVDDVNELAPPGWELRFRASSRGERAALHMAPTRSRIKMCGLDRNLDGLRGRGTDGVVITEAGFVAHLEEAVLRVVYPQMQQRPHADILLVSTPPEVAGHIYDDAFVPDAIARGAYVMRTIDENPLLSIRERDEFVAAAMLDNAYLREYYCQRLRDAKKRVIPEWDSASMCREYERPERAFRWIGVDPGSRDHTGVVAGYYDFKNAKLVIERSETIANASTGSIADAIRAINNTAYAGSGSLLAWDASRNAYVDRMTIVSDVDPRLVTDMRTQYGLELVPASKTDSLESRLNALRHAVQSGSIVVTPSAGSLALELESAVWNKMRTDFERTKMFGHLDRLMALCYLWRAVDRSANPYRPKPMDPMERALAERARRDKLLGRLSQPRVQ